MADVQIQASKFEEIMEMRGIKFTRHEDAGEHPHFSLLFGGGDFSFQHLSIHVLFDPDGESVKVRTSTVLSAPLDKVARILLACNECNAKFRWAKFYLDSDNDVVADTDVIIDDFTAGEMCRESVMRMASIVDEAYPILMKALWAD